MNNPDVLGVEYESMVLYNLYIYYSLTERVMIGVFQREGDQ